MSKESNYLVQCIMDILPLDEKLWEFVKVNASHGFKTQAFYGTLRNFCDDATIKNVCRKEQFSLLR